MSQVIDLDVLVVYSADAALSASVNDSFSKHPFLIDSKQSNYNLSYAYFLQQCKDMGMTAGFAASSDIVGPGMCSHYWTIENSRWIKVDSRVRATQIFDKLSPSCDLRSAERLLLLSNKAVTSFNDPDIFAIFFDKLATYRRLPEYAIPTVPLRSSRGVDISSAISRLTSLVKKHNLSDDFSEELILKDRFGSGGNHIHKIEGNFVPSIQKLMKRTHEIKYVLQPFLHFNRGYEYANTLSSIDIRLIFLNSDLLQIYIRIANSDSFLCNQHQGGQVEYISTKDVPSKVLRAAKRIVRKVNNSQSLYALDFVVSNNGNVFFLEGNAGPGINWDSSNFADQKKSKQLITHIVTELSRRAQQ
jgi:glutathione synthase/RimK-type ligase-like ATP-grasp enzyme